MFISYCITYKAISSPLVAAVASAAAVAVASAAGSGAHGRWAVATVAEKAVVGATAVCNTMSDLTQFSTQKFELFEVLYFHNSLEIIFRNFNNSFLTSVISLQATFGI